MLRPARSNGTPSAARYSRKPADVGAIVAHRVVGATSYPLELCEVALEDQVGPGTERSARRERRFVSGTGSAGRDIRAARGDSSHDTADLRAPPVVPPELASRIAHWSCPVRVIRAAARRARVGFAACPRVLALLAHALCAGRDEVDCVLHSERGRVAAVRAARR